MNKKFYTKFVKIGCKYILLLSVLAFFSCEKESEKNDKSNDAKLLSLEIEVKDQVYGTLISGNAVMLDNQLFTGVEVATIKTFQISSKAQTNIFLNQTFVVNNGLLIQVIAEDGTTQNTYTLTFDLYSNPELLFNHFTNSYCYNFALIPVGELLITNNTWNSVQFTEGDYSQCIYFYKDEFKQLFGWNWSYPSNAYGISAYPEVVFGWKPWSNISTTIKLPKKLNDISKLKVVYDSEINANDKDYNLAFDLWINSGKEISPANIQFELMIWEDMQNLNPFGDFIENVVTTNGTYKFYMGETDSEPEGSDWTYLAFSRIEKRQKGEVDVDELLEYLKNKGIVSSESYLSAIEFGNEVGNSSGYCIVKRFDVVLE